VLQTEGAAGIESPAVGRRFVLHTAAMTSPARPMLDRGKHQTWSAPASRRVFRLPAAGPAWRQITILWQQIARWGATARP